MKSSRKLHILSLLLFLFICTNSIYGVTYYSIATGNWNATSTWSLTSGGSAGSAIPGNGDIAYVESGKNVTVNANTANLSLISISAGSTLTVNPNFTVSSTTITVNGLYVNNSSGAITKTTMTIGSSGTYQHNLNSGTIPIATWDPASTCLITGMIATSPTGFNQSFGNFTWNCASQTGAVITDGDITVNGSFTLTAGTFALSNGSTARNIYIANNYYQSGGVFDFNTGTTNVITKMYVGGNFTNTTTNLNPYTGFTDIGTVTTSGSGATNGEIVFNGTSTQNINLSRANSSQWVSFTINSGSSVALLSNLQLTGATSGSPTVANFNVNGSLDAKTFTITYSGTTNNGTTFNLNSGGTLTTANTTGVAGSVPTNAGIVRTFSTSANYTFNGGSQTTTDLPATVVNLTFSGSGTKTLLLATTIKSFSISGGAVANLGTGLTHTVNDLYFDGAKQVSGSWGGTGSAATNINTTYFSNSTGIVYISEIWTGATSSDWNDPTNWSQNVIPDATWDVNIPNVTNKPVIGTSASCKNITINASSSLTINGTNTFSVGGNMTNNGTFTANSSTVIFNGAAQTITGTNTFNNVTFGGSGVKTITTANFTVNGILSMEGTATISAAPTYGSTATLQYYSTSAKTAGTEWISPFVASGGIIIGSTGIITMNSNEVLNSTAALTINSGATLAMSTFSLTLNGNLINNGGTTSGSGGVIITGTATQSIGSFTNTGTVSMTKTAGTATFTGNINGGPLTINGIGGTLNLGSGLTHTFTGNISLTNGTLNGGSSILNENSSTTSAWTGAGTNFIAGTSTVVFGGAAQSLATATTFYNLTFRNSGIKTLNGTPTISNILSIEGTAMLSKTPIYSSSATLQYNTTTARTLTASSYEWITPFAATGGIVITNTGAITLNAAKVLNNNIPLMINSGATLATGNFQLTFGGDFINNGTFTAGSSPIVITGTTTVQNIAGFTTTGAISMTKTSGTATFQGNVNAGALTINGSGGTLNLGSGLTHTFTGNITLTAGTLNGGSSTLQANSSTTTAWTGTGSNFTAGTGTVSFGGVNQTINTATTFNNLTLSGSGTKTFGAIITTSGIFSFRTGVLANLGTFTHSAGYLYEAGVNKIIGSYGSTASTATYKDATYFGTTATGLLNVSTSTGCSGGNNTWTGAVSTDWNIAGNWCGGIPTSATNVIIPSGGNQPTISSAATCAGVIINSGATLTISGSNTLSVKGDWQNDGTFTANSSTVNFSSLAAQSILGANATTFYNLTVSNGGTITLATIPTVNGILSIEGAPLSAAPTYGASATLQYNSASPQTVGAEWISPFIASGGIIIKNSGVVTLNGAKQIGNNTNVPLNINSGATLATANFGLTFHGDFINAGTLSAGSSPITFDGTTSAQNIAGFTTTGTVTCNKSAGTATLTGAMNTGGLINSTPGGTLHLGTGLTHTLTGAWTRTNGTLNGGSSILNIGGNVTNSGGAFTPGTGTVNYNGTTAPQVTASVNYYHLTLSGTGAKTLQTGTTTIGGNFTLSGTASATTVANLAISGNLNIGTGTTLTTASTFTFGVTGTSTITGTYTDGSTGIKTFTGNVSLNSGAVWNETAVSAYSIAGNFTNNATTFTGNSGVHTFTGTTKTVSGSTAISIPATTISGTYTNNGILTVNTALAGSGTLTQGVGSTLNIGGTSTISTLSAGSNSNTVNYTGASQTILPISYYHLTLSGSGTATLTGISTINGNLTTSGTVTVNAATGLTIGGNVSIGSTSGFVAGSYTHNIGGNWTKNGSFNSTGSTINFNGSSAQIISASVANFNNIIFSGTGNITAAGILGIGGDLTINSGSTFVAGNYTHTLKGNWINNGSFTAGSSTISLINNASQNIGGSASTTFNNLGMNGTGGATLGIATSVAGTLTLNLSKLSIGNYNLILTPTGTISGGSSTSYVKTSGTGRLKQQIAGQTTKSYPVGNTAYNPIVVTNNGANSTDNYSIRIGEGTITNANSSKTVNRQWYIMKDLVGSTNLTLAATYNPGEEGSGFNNSTNPAIGYFSGSIWVNQPIISGSGTTTFTANGSAPDMSNANGYLALGSGDAFNASKLSITVLPPTPYRGQNSSIATIQSLNSNNIPTYVNNNTTFDLTSNVSFQRVGGLTGFTLAAGSYQTIINNIQFNISTWNDLSQAFDLSATVTATATTGESLSAGVTPNFAIKEGTIYQPKTSGNWSTVQWQISTDGGTTWSNTSLPTDNVFAETDLIQVPVGITLTADVTASFYSLLLFGTMNINSSGTLTINHSALDASDYNLEVYGTLENSGGTLLNSNVSYVAVEFFGGTYWHNMNGGYIPIAKWNSLNGVVSTCNVTGITSTSLSGLNQSFQNFTWNNSGQGSTLQMLDGDMTVNGTLALTSGILTTGSNRIISTLTGSITRTTGYINGNLRIYVPNLTSKVFFPTGDATNYAPMTINLFGSVTGSGYLDNFTTTAQPPAASGLSQTKYINRKWRIYNNGVGGFTSFNVKVTFADGDKVGNPVLSNLALRRVVGNTWFSTNGVDTLNTITATGFNTPSIPYSEYYIGENDCNSTNAVWYGSTSTDWNTGTNWCSGIVPTSTTDVTIPSSPTNQPTINASAGCNNITIQSGASLTLSGSNLLDVKSNWINNGTFTANSGSVSFTGATAQTITGSSTFYNLTINNSAGVTGVNNITLNGTLTLTSANPNASHGTMDMGNNTLSMLNATATVIGTGDVTGIVKRTHVFTPNNQYSFGSQYTTLNFLGTGTRPSEITCRISLGSNLPDKANAVSRYYSFAQTGTTGTDKVTANLRYLTSELNGNTEPNLVLWDRHFSGNVEEHGKTNNSTVNHWVGISGLSISYVAPTTIDNKNWGLANYTAAKNTWVGGADTDWNNSANWTAGHAPDTTDDVLIPDVSSGSNNSPVLTSNVEIHTLEITIGATLTASSYTLTINGYTNAWSNNGTFIPGTGTLSFTHGVSTDEVSISGNGVNQFNNITISANTFIKPGTGVIIKISGMVNGDITSIVDLSTLGNTIEYNGTDQYIVNPLTAGFSFSGYYNLTISGSGTKTLVDNLTLSGNLTNNGTLSTGTGTISFIGTIAQTVSGTSTLTCNNLIINNSAGVSSSIDLTVNGTLTISTDNPSTNDKGALDMTNSSVLHMGAISSTSGPGDVSGIINRSHTFNTSTFYSFGNQNNGVTFASVSTYPGQTLPSSVSLNVHIGTAPNWSANSGAVMTNPIKRYYDIFQTGGNGTRALLQVHYKDNEVPTGVTKNQLTIWSCSNIAGTFYNKESGRSSYDLTNDFVTIQDVDFAKISSTLGNFKGTLAPSSSLNYTWIGTIDTNWNNSANWTPNGVPDATHGAIIPDTNTTPYDPTLPSTASCISLQIDAGGILSAPASGGTFIISGANAAWSVDAGGVFNANTSTVTFNANASSAGDVSIVGSTNFYNLIISSGTLLRPALNSYTGIANTLTNSGILAAATNECTFEFNGTSFQTILNPNGSTPGYHSLILSGSGYKVLPTTLNIVDELIDNTPGSGVILAGTGAVILNGNSIYGQTISGTSTMTNFNNLTIDNPGNTVSVNKQITVSNILNITTGSVMDMGINALSGGTNTSMTGTGTIYTQHAYENPLPGGRIWSGTMIFNGTTPQYVTNGTYNNLTITNSSGAIAFGNLTVNGVLNLSQNNPSSTIGLFDTGSYTLNMGVSSVTSGIGDVTGVVKRQHSFITGQPFTFGNQNTKLTFMGVSGNVKPVWVSCKIAIGTAPSWKTGGVLRTYNFAQDGTGTDDVTTNLHYLTSELNSNDETKIVLWDHHTNGTIDQHGKTNNDVTNKWIGLSGLKISYLAPATVLTDKQWGLSNSTIVRNTWLCADGTTNWDVPQNWSAGHYPSQSTYNTDSVLIPAGKTNYPSLTLPVEMSTIEIEAGASLIANSYNVTISGSTAAWFNNGTFTSTSGSLIFSKGNLSKVVTLEGVNNTLYNLQVEPNTFIQPASGSYMKIGGSIITDPSSVLDFTSNQNIVEFNGGNQTITNISGPSSSYGYHDLIVSNTGTKTIPSTLNIAGDFANNGTIDALTNSSTVIFKDQGHVQNIGGSTTSTFYNLSIENDNQVVTASSNFNVNNALNVSSGTTLDLTTTVLGGSLSTTSGTGTLKTQSTSSTPFPSGLNWSFGVIMNSASSAQTIPVGTYSSLQISSLGQTTVAGALNCTTLTIDNGATLNMGTYALTGGSTISGTGTLKTQNTSTTPIPSGKNWPGSVVYNGSGAQTAVDGTFGNINIDNTVGVLMASGANATVNGTLLINSGRYFEIGSGTEVSANLVTNNAGISGLKIKSNSAAANGTFIFNNTSDYPVSGTVEMYSKAAASTYNSSTGKYSNYKWQYFGIPVQSVVATPTFDGSFVRKHEESGTTSASLWVSQSNGSILTPTAGYEITQVAEKTITFQGALVNSILNKTLTMTTGAMYPGQNLYSNPYTAAIDIRKITFGSDTEASVYLYNTGSHDDWSSYSVNGNNPGQYTVVPINDAGKNGVPFQIPSMQGFMVNAKNGTTSATISIPYSAASLTKNVDLQKAKKSDSDLSISTQIDISGSRFTDKMWVFVDPSCTRGFDNGWDGYKYLGTSLAPQLWAMEGDGDYQIDAVADINNTELGFMTGEDSDYTLTFNHENMDQQYSALYLIDLITGTTTDITANGSKYSFTAVSSTTPTKRFRIVTAKETQTNNQETEANKLNIYSSFKTIFVQNYNEYEGSVIVTDLTGRTLSSSKANANGLTTIPTNLIQGSYLVTVSTAKEKTTKQIIIR
jgi:hypothetical protein